MKIEIMLSILIPLIALPIIAIISFFLKGLLKSVHITISKLGQSIEDLDSKFSDFN